VDLRRIGNLFNLSTVLGVLLATAGRARIHRGPHGLLLAERCRLPLFGAGAMTIASVVLTSGTFASLVGRLPRVLDHESRHATQWLALGLLLLPAYALGALWSVLSTGDRAAGNPFERAAGLADGGYAATRRH
jgi:hypothetical protein